MSPESPCCMFPTGIPSEPPHPPFKPWAAPCEGVGCSPEQEFQFPFKNRGREAPRSSPQGPRKEASAHLRTSLGRVLWAPTQR